MQLLGSIAELLTPEQLTELKENILVSKFKKNQIIYDSGSRPEYLYCLLDGKVKVYRDGLSGRSQIVHVFKPGEYFGYRAFFAGENYVTTSAVFEPCTTCMIPLSLIKKWLASNIRLSNYFIHILSQELGNSDARIVSLTQKHVPARLAETLVFLHDTYGVEEDGITLSLQPSREDLASLSNMTTSNAIRTLSAFANNGLIETEGRIIRFLNLDEIIQISQRG